MTAVLAESPLVSWYVQLDGHLVDPPTLLEDGLRTGYTFVVSFLAEQMSVRGISQASGAMVHVRGRRYLADGTLGSSTGSRSYEWADIPDELRPAALTLTGVSLA